MSNTEDNKYRSVVLNTEIERLEAELHYFNENGYNPESSNYIEVERQLHEAYANLTNLSEVIL